MHVNAEKTRQLCAPLAEGLGALLAGALADAGAAWEAARKQRAECQRKTSLSAASAANL